MPYRYIFKHRVGVAERSPSLESTTEDRRIEEEKRAYVESHGDVGRLERNIEYILANPRHDIGATGWY